MSNRKIAAALLATPIIFSAIARWAEAYQGPPIDGRIVIDAPQDDDPTPRPQAPSPPP